MIKAVMFDYYGVMCPRIALLIARGTAKQFGVTNEKSMEVVDYLLGMMDENKLAFYKYWKALKLKFQNENVKLSDHRKIWEDSMSYLDLRPKMVDLVKKIKKGGYKVPLLSNVLRKMALYNRTKGRYRLFRPLFLSYRIGTRKPFPKIFKHALKKLRVKPEECLFIDDQISYLEGAKPLGIKTILFKNHSQLVRDLKRFDVRGV